MRTYVYRLLAVTGLLLLYSWAHAAPVEGLWTTIDDHDNSPKSIVRLTVNDAGQLEGTIVKLLRKEAQGEKCEKCPDRFHNKPMVGLTFMWGLTSDTAGQWHGGKILDPKSGKIYKAKVTLDKAGDGLTVRGFIGFSIFGRSQHWLRKTPESAE